MNRRRSASVVANPVLVGAVTVLVVVIAVFLAYNANNGLPFVPTRSLKVQISNGANLVPGNEIRSGGFRIGVVEDMKPIQLPNGNVVALLSLKLDRKIGAVPVDTTIKVRPRSALGLKYVEFTKGRSSKTLPDGATLPESQATVPVELDEFFNIFDKKTRSNAQRNLRGYGDAFAGRGFDLNRFVESAPRLFGGLTSVGKNLNDPRTGLDRFFVELGDFFRVLAPVSKVNAHLFTTMADTFGAIARDPQALKDTIAQTPSTLDVATRSLRVQRPLLNDFADLSTDLNGATRELRAALPTVNRALKVAIPVQRRSVLLDRDLQSAMRGLKSLADAPTTNAALRGLIATVTTLQPQLRYIGPYVTVCNDWNIWWTFVAEHFTAPDATGGSQRAMLNMGAPQDDSITTQGANEFVHGKGVVPGVNGGRPQFLHSDVFGNRAVNPKGQADCQSAQAGFIQASNPYREQGIPGDPYRNVVVDTPTDQQYPNFPLLGPTFKTFDKQAKGHGLNPTQVPAGETFTSEPGGLGANP
jgi:virulence factor Mce-like protein